MGRGVLGFTAVISWAWQTENGAVKGDSASRMIHAAQNLESTVGGLKRLSRFRARDIERHFSKTAASDGVRGRAKRHRFPEETEKGHRDGDVDPGQNCRISRYRQHKYVASGALPLQLETRWRVDEDGDRRHGRQKCLLVCVN